MSDRVPSDCLLSSWMLRNIHEQKEIKFFFSAVVTDLTVKLKYSAIVENSYKLCSLHENFNPLESTLI